MAEAARGGFKGALRRMLDRRLGHDGPAAARRQARPGPDADEDARAGRRDRRLRLPQEILDRSLSGKVLDGWLQNRIQILVPLTFRFDRLEAGDVALVMAFTAVAVLDATAADAVACRFAERWLGTLGAGPDAIGPFRDALRAPPPLGRILAALRERDLGPYAYAAAVAAVDTREPAGRLFASFIAARLALPADAVRSIDRRARR